MAALRSYVWELSVDMEQNSLLEDSVESTGLALIKCSFTTSGQSD